MLFTMYRFREFTGTGVRNGAQIKTPQARKETRARAESRGGCPRSLLCKKQKGESMGTTLLREYMHVDRPPGYSLSC